MDKDVNDVLIAVGEEHMPELDKVSAPMQGPPRLRVVDPEAPVEDAATAQVQLESALVASLLWSGTYGEAKLHAGLVKDLLTPEMFVKASHRAVFAIIAQRNHAKLPVDAMSVFGVLVERGTARSVGGAEYLEDLVANAPPTTEQQLRGYAGAVRTAWLRRRLIDLGGDLAKSARDGRIPVARSLHQARAALDELTCEASVGASVVMVREVIEQIAREDQLPAVQVADTMPSGFRSLDFHFHGGIPFPQVTVIAARTSVGKTVLSNQIAKNLAATQEGVGVLIVSIEMKAKRLAHRMIASEAGIDLKTIKNRSFTNDERARYAAAQERLSALPLAIADSRAQGMQGALGTVEATAQRFAGMGKRLRLVVLDQASLVKPESRAEEALDERRFASKVSRWCGHIAERFECAVFELIQVGRESERQGKDTTPKLHHLKASGAIEEDTDNVVIIHRARKPSGHFDDGPAKIIVAKARDGVVGSFQLQMDPKYARFSELPSLQMEAASRVHAQGYFGGDDDE